MLQQHLLDYSVEVSLIIKKATNKSATSGAQVVTIRIPTICLYNFEQTLINILSKR